MYELERQCRCVQGICISSGVDPAVGRRSVQGAHASPPASKGEKDRPALIPLQKYDCRLQVALPLAQSPHHIRRHRHHGQRRHRHRHPHPRRCCCRLHYHRCSPRDHCHQDDEWEYLGCQRQASGLRLLPGTLLTSWLRLHVVVIPRCKAKQRGPGLRQPGLARPVLVEETAMGAW